jgi:hypothetical protein
MKLSLWQQFSGNHSSSFTVIGEFPTREEAERAAKEIRTILARIEAWHKEHADDDEIIDMWEGGEWTVEPFPIETQIAQDHNIEWESGIDWFHSANIEIVMDRLVFLTPSQRPETDGHPFDQIMTRLGGRGYHHGDRAGDQTAIILLDMTCIAPDEQTAEEMRSHLGRYSTPQERISRQGLQLRLERWHYDALFGFPELIQMLQGHGFTDIEYSFTQLNPDDDEFEDYEDED